MASVKKGKINNLVFDIKGNNYKSRCHTTFLYNDLAVTVLKMNENHELKKRGLLSLLANTLIANNNPKNNNTYIGEIDFTRDTQKSFLTCFGKVFSMA